MSGIALRQRVTPTACMPCGVNEWRSGVRAGSGVCRWYPEKPEQYQDPDLSCSRVSTPLNWRNRGGFGPRAQLCGSRIR